MGIWVFAFFAGLLFLSWVFDVVKKRKISLGDYQILVAGLAISAALYLGLKEMKPMTEFDACVNSFMSIPDFDYTSQSELLFRIACTPSGD